MNDKLKVQVANYVATYRSMVSPAPGKPASTPTLTDNERKIFIEAEKAWANYSNSTAGKKQLNALKSMDLANVQSYVANILDNPEFDKLKSLLNSLDLPASSFSIGLDFEAELIIGFSGTIGIAIGIGDSKGLQSAEFLSLSLVEGVEAGAFAGVQFGLWDNAPSDLGGYSWGTEADFGFEVEASGAIYYSASGGLLGVTVTIGAGIDEGIAETESYTFILGDQGENPYLKPVVQPRKNNFLILESLKCEHPSNDSAGNENEVYFIFRADNDETQYPYPTYDYFSMKEGDVWQCGRSVWFDSNVQVTVYDEDGTSGNDIVGTFSINLSNLSLGQTVTFNSTKDYSSGFDDVEYTINVKLVAQDVAT